jgi:hypothetical protein
MFDAPKTEPASASKAAPQVDQMCLQDCRNNGGTREFCEDRCTN